MSYNIQAALLSHTERILSILKPDNYTLDVFGRNIAQVLLLWKSKLEGMNDGLLQTRLSDLLSRYGDCKPPQKLFESFKSTKYLEWIKITRSIGCIDQAGDGPLLSMSKGWTNEETEPVKESIQLLNMGFQVHDRDRTGNTPLLVAVTRGLPEITNLLLNNGGNPNIRSNYGESLLSQAERCLTRAKRIKNEELHGKVWYCIRLVADAGAVADPSPLQEWGSLAIPNR